VVITCYHYHSTAKADVSYDVVFFGEPLRRWRQFSRHWTQHDGHVFGSYAAPTSWNSSSPVSRTGPERAQRACFPIRKDGTGRARLWRSLAGASRLRQRQWQRPWNPLTNGLCQISVKKHSDRQSRRDRDLASRARLSADLGILTVSSNSSDCCRHLLCSIVKLRRRKARCARRPSRPGGPPAAYLLSAYRCGWLRAAQCERSIRAIK